jgi:hypothetical protein
LRNTVFDRETPEKRIFRLETDSLGGNELRSGDKEPYLAEQEKHQFKTKDQDQRMLLSS